MTGSQPKPINPIIPSFAPDPSVTWVGDTFFLVNSSFHIFPGLPIYASKDLVSWTHIGNAINRQSQISLLLSSTKLHPQKSSGEVLLGTGGLYAPTIGHHEGRTYIVCTNVIHPEVYERDLYEYFVVWTDDIHGDKWSDPVYFEFRGIDPSLFFDDDGRAYIQGSAWLDGVTKIHNFEIDLLTGKKLSEEKFIWEGSGGIFPEGPHVYKKDGYYYLMISEGGTHEGHMITVARSKKGVWGMYKAYKKNPILTARGTDEYIQYTGHCDVVQDSEGNWWGVSLGVRKHSTGAFTMGRETFLTPCEWPEKKWPSLSRVKMNPKREDGADVVRTDRGLRAERKLHNFVYISDPKMENYEFSLDGTLNRITVKTGTGDMDQWKEPVSFVGLRQRQLNDTCTVQLYIPLGWVNIMNLRAGLAVYKDEHRYARVYYDHDKESIVFQVVNKAKSISRESRYEGFHLSEYHALAFFSVEHTETSYRFVYRGVKEDCE